jgi:hypothetical protein
MQLLHLDTSINNQRWSIPILKRGSLVGSQGGAVYTLTQDVDFTASNNEITVARVDSDTGVPTFFAIKGQGTVVSGRLFEEEVSVTNYERFLRLKLAASDVSEIIAVVDSQGNDWKNLCKRSNI